MKFLVTGAWSDAKKCIFEIEKMGHTVVFMQYEKEELPCEYDWVEGAICNGLFLYHDVQKFTNLKYIQLTSAGYDRVPIDYIKAHNIEINNARGVYSIPMSEFAIASVLQFYKQSRLFYYNQKVRKWEKRRDLQELTDKIVCIIGCGSVGVECAKRFNAFGCNVIGVDVVALKSKNFKKIYPINDLNEILKKADVVILTLPLTGQTHHLINKDNLALLKRGCVLVNIARGKIIDTYALIDFLNQKKLYAALDVFEEEPLAENSPLWNMDNVILTPHNSFVGDFNSNRLHDLIIEKLKGR